MVGRGWRSLHELNNPLHSVFEKFLNRYRVFFISNDETVFKANQKQAVIKLFMIPSVNKFLLLDVD